MNRINGETFKEIPKEFSSRNSGDFSGRTTEKFPVELQMNFWGIVGGTQKEFVEKLGWNCWSSLQGIAERTMKKIWVNYRWNAEGLHGKTLIELLEEPR